MQKNNLFTLPLGDRINHVKQIIQDIKEGSRLHNQERYRSSLTPNCYCIAGWIINDTLESIGTSYQALQGKVMEELLLDIVDKYGNSEQYNIMYGDDNYDTETYFASAFLEIPVEKGWTELFRPGLTIEKIVIALAKGETK